MKEIKITRNVFMFAFDNEADLCLKVLKTDDIVVTDKVDFEDVFNRNKYNFSRINRDKILQEFNKLSTNYKWIIVRYI